MAEKAKTTVQNAEKKSGAKELVKKAASEVKSVVEKAGSVKNDVAASKTVAAVKEEAVSAVKETAAKVETVKKAVKKTVKSAGKRTKLQSAVYVQFDNKSISSDGLIERVREIMKEKKVKASDLKDVKVYVNVAESKAYYVVNEEMFGEFPL